MFGDIVGWIFGGAPRSGKWPAVRRKFLEGKDCAACGQITELEAHHIEPFDKRPDLELDTGNLIALCRQCHFFIGHVQDWSVVNPYVRIDSAWYRQRYMESRRRPGT